MKLSKSKLALAKVINENGGWVDGAKFSSQDKDGNTVCFYSNSKPTKPSRGELKWKSPIGTGYMGDCDINAELLIENWHQCVLSREEYYHAYPKADADGWIEWHGVAKSPVSKGVSVDVKMKNGTQHFGQLIDDECWGDHWGDASIIAYRLHKQEVKPELCESVTRSIPEPESIDELCAKVTEESKHQRVDAKPTIEQLAQDYRKKLDFANRKQLEAEDARVAADAALGELERAGEAIGLVIGVAKPNPVIADWRDLMERDVIWFGGDDEQAAGEYSVLEVEHADYGGNRAIRIDTVGNDYWIDVTDDWKFIRRP